MEKIKKIFLDFDECMAHSMYADSEKHADQLVDMYGEHWRGEKFYTVDDLWEMGGGSKEWYVTFKRSWTDDLIKFSREQVGHDNVYILTASVGEYIRWCNVKLELGFDPNTQIYSREDISRHHVHQDFKESHNILVDNLKFIDQHMHNYSKIDFLNNLPEKQYVNVNPFEVWREDIGYQTSYFEKLKTRIKMALATWN